MCVYSTDITTTTTVQISTEFTIGVSRRDKINANYRMCVYSSNTMNTITVNDARGVFSTKSYGKQQLFTIIYSVVCTYGVCIFAGMYCNISVICLCWREVCQGGISCRHVEQQPQLTPTKQVCKNVLWARKHFVQNKASRVTISWPKCGTWLGPATRTKLGKCSSHITNRYKQRLVNKRRYRPVQSQERDNNNN